MSWLRSQDRVLWRAHRRCVRSPQEGENDDHALGTELWECRFRTQILDAPRPGSTRSQQVDSKRMTTSVRRTHHRPHPNILIKSGPESLSPPGHFRLVLTFITAWPSSLYEATLSNI